MVMVGQIILGLVVGFPLLIGLLFRASMSHLFFSLMAGELLGRYFGEDLDLVISAFFPKTDLRGYGAIALLVLPMLLTAVFLKGTISKGKVVLHIIPLIVTGVIFAAFLAPILPANIQDVLASFGLGRQLLDLNKVIIGGMVALQLLALWLLNRGGESRRKRGE